jgi:hypothetical protein
VVCLILADLLTGDGFAQRLLDATKTALQQFFIYFAHNNAIVGSGADFCDARPHKAAAYYANHLQAHIINSFLQVALRSSVCASIAEKTPVCPNCARSWR